MKFPVKVMSTIVFLMSACSQVPKEASHSLTYQKKLQSTDHWEKVSANVSNKVINRLKNELEVDRMTGKLGMTNGSGHVMPEPYHGGEVNSFGPICIAQNDKSEFGNSIQTFLKEDFFDKGINISCSQGTPYTLEWEVSINKFNSNRANYNPGLLQIIVETPVYLLFGGDDFDINKPHAEVVVTFLLKNNFSESTLVRDSSAFYINDEDSKQYWITKSEYSENGTTGSKKFFATNK